jgi:transposase-like protein
MPMLVNINTSEIKENIKTNQSIYDFINNSVLEYLKKLLETILEVNFEEIREKIDKKGSFQRNGYYTRSLLTKFGLIENLKVPRYRKSKFINSLFKPWQRRCEDVEETIIKLFVQGESFRDIRRMVGHLYGEKTMSISTISKIINTMQNFVKEFHQRKIQKEYSVIWIDAIYFPVKNGKKLKKGKNFCVLVALGLDKETNKKEVIDFMPASGESQQEYLKFLDSLISRGLKIGAIEVIVHDGDWGIKSALEIVFGDKVKQQDCIFHKLQNIGNAVRDKSKKKKILSEASEVYKSMSYQEYIKKRKEFINRYRYKEPEVVKIFKSDELIKTKFSLDVQLYHLINTTTPIDRMFREVRRRTNAIGCFENKFSLDKIFFLIINFNNQLLGNASFVKSLQFTQF